MSISELFNKNIPMNKITHILGQVLKEIPLMALKVIRNLLKKNRSIKNDNLYINNRIFIQKQYTF